MILKTTTIAAMLALCSHAAIAQVVITGGGMGKDCYEAAKYDRNSPQAAEKICSQALQFETLNKKNRAATYTNRGIVRMRNARYDGALSDYSAAKRLNANIGATWLNEGAALIYKKRYSEALVSLDKSIELGTQEPYAAYYNRAIAREHTGDVQGAYYDFKKSLELRPDFKHARDQLSRFSVVNN